MTDKEESSAAGEADSQKGSPIVYGITVLTAVIVVLLVRQFVIEPFTVPTGSMEPTVVPHESVLAEKITLAFGGSVHDGDIIVLENPEGSQSDARFLLKRVVATGGETVGIKNGRLYVDGKLRKEPYVKGRTEPLEEHLKIVPDDYPYTVPDGYIWVMGDNREDSADSRYFGAVASDSVIGIVVARYWPVSRAGTL